ncbi:septum site-determining protein MinC [Rhabdochromatium marinum]|nr:septum site-determining protein MinC [Rhabdochromatium marinum]
MAMESERESAATALEIKAAAFTLPVIRLFQVDMGALAEQLQAKVEQAPDLFAHAPVVIDLSGLDDPDADISFPRLVGLLRGYGMLPVGLRGGSMRHQEAAHGMALALMSDGSSRRMREAANGDASVAVTHAINLQIGRTQNQDDPMDAGIGLEVGSTLIRRPVRSGQKVYAAGGDLTVTAAVSSGAELMADGNIHIYGPLRGRVFAGIKGNTKARIFCQDLQAELVAVAGHYRVSENIPLKLKHARVQIFLEKHKLRIEPF